MKCKVILLATDKYPALLKSTMSDKMYGMYNCAQRMPHSLHHLYFVSDEEIQVGDWIYDTVLMNRVEKAVYDNTYLTRDWKKVVATTDKSLQLPSIPESFLKEYVEKNGSINEVEIEYTCLKHYWKDRSNIDNIIVYNLEDVGRYNCIFDFYPSKPILNNNNEVITSQPKETWTRDEVITLMETAFDEGFSYSLIPGTRSKTKFNTWLQQQNLK